MNARTLKRLAVIVAALVVVWLGLGLLRRARADTAAGLALPRYQPASVDQALIVKGADTLRFERRPGGWTVNGLRADPLLVGELVSALSDTSARTSLATESAASEKRLGLDRADARTFTLLEAGHRVADLRVGNQGEPYPSVYVRLPGHTRSYELNGRLADLVVRGLNFWRDKTIAEVHPDSVQAVEVRRGRERYTLTLSGGQWRLGGRPADSTAVADLLDRYRNLVADGFPTAAEDSSLSRWKDDRAIRLLAAGGRPLLVLGVDSIRTGYFARRQGGVTTYRLEDWNVNQLVPADSTLLPKAPKAKKT